MPAERKPTTTSPARGARPVDQLVAPDEADDRPAEVELVVPVDPRQLGGLAAEDRAPGGAADVRGALDELHDLLRVDRPRGDVVEEEEWLRAGRRDVVDPVGGEVGAAPAERPRAPCEDELRADRVRRGGEQPLVVEREQPRERAERADHAVRARRLDCGAQALDHGAGGRERDACGGVRLRVSRHRFEPTQPADGGPAPTGGSDGRRFEAVLRDGARPARRSDSAA